MQYHHPTALQLLTQPNRATLYHSKHAQHRLSHSEPSHIAPITHQVSRTPRAVNPEERTTSFKGEGHKQLKRLLQPSQQQRSPFPVPLLRLSHHNNPQKPYKVRKTVTHRPVQLVHNEFDVTEAQLLERQSIKDMRGPYYDCNRTALRYHGQHKIFETAQQSGESRDVTPPLSRARGDLTTKVSSGGQSLWAKRTKNPVLVREGSLEYSFEEGEASWGRGGKESKETDWIDFCQLEG